MTALAQGHNAYGLSPDAPQVEAAAKRLWSFLGLRRPWDQATEVARDKARMLAAVVMEALLTHEREMRSATAEDTILARFWPPSDQGRGAGQARCARGRSRSMPKTSKEAP